MKSIKDYDRMVCIAVKNDPIGFIDALNDEANRNENSGLAPLLREAACVIANLMERLGIPEKEGM